MNLLDENWLPVMRSSGQTDWITPSQISDPDIVSFAANRADFNGALAQLMIGLLQTTTTIDDELDWKEFFNTPPSSTDLKKWFAPVAEAFVFDGDGARFMQDFSLTEGTECSIDALLIDSAGKSSIDKNIDHFVKRDTVTQLCPHCVATALFTLQTNAPSGGVGHRTSLRGGGPLTTLVVSSPTRSLWHDLWLNVTPQLDFLQQCGDVNKKESHFTFPWLANIGKIQAETKDSETQPLQAHPHHVFWAMPRRIRLDLSDNQMGVCAICKRNSNQLVNKYITKNYGLNYNGPWRHPLSPYYEHKNEWLPIHPQPGGFSYKNWLPWALGNSDSKNKIQAAITVNYVLGSHRRKLLTQSRLWVFGYDMDNMKARCWYETTFPLYNLVNIDIGKQKFLQEIIKNYIESAEQTVFYLHQAVKTAWFGDGDSHGNLDFVDKFFWDNTEHIFYQQLKTLIDNANMVDMDDSNFLTETGEYWLKILREKAFKLFDSEIIGSGFSQQNPRRIADSYNSLRKNLDGKSIRTILRLPLKNKDFNNG